MGIVDEGRKVPKLEMIEDKIPEEILESAEDEEE